MDVAVLNQALLKILYDFRVVNNSCEKERTILSWFVERVIMGWSQIDVKEEGFKGAVFDPVPADQENFSFIRFMVDNEYFLSCFISY